MKGFREVIPKHRALVSAKQQRLIMLKLIKFVSRTDGKECNETRAIGLVTSRGKNR